MPLHITIDKLFEYLVAAVLRYSGYFAGVPTKKMGGRSTKHQIDVVGIEFNHLPFIYDVLLIVEAKCYNITQAVGIGAIRQIKSNVDDFNQTLPNYLNPLPRNIAPHEYFVRHFGNGNAEEWTVNYRGAVFTTSHFSSGAKQFAYAHGIYLVNFPNYFAGKIVEDWLKIIKRIIESISSFQILKRYVPTAGRYAFRMYMQILDKLRDGSYSDLTQEERHRLFTLIRGVIEHDQELIHLRSELLKLTLGLYNGYPVLVRMSEKINFRIVDAINRANSHSLEKYSSKRIFGIRRKISEIRAYEKYRESISDSTQIIGFEFQHESVPLDIRCDLFVQIDLHDFSKLRKEQLIIPLMQDLNIVTEISKENLDENQSQENFFDDS